MAVVYYLGYSVIALGILKYHTVVGKCCLVAYPQKDVAHVGELCAIVWRKFGSDVRSYLFEWDIKLKCAHPPLSGREYLCSVGSCDIIEFYEH